jgi:uncharacterized oxidoreductase
MELSGNTVFVTGGATGIGLAFARRFLAAGSRVVACGRREEALSAARRAHPDLETFVCDLASAEGRRAAADRIVREFPETNVLVNNAGIQRRVRVDGADGWDEVHSEIAINLEAPVHLSMLLVPHLLGRERPAIVNVGSGLAFVPLASVPIYCATKAAIHSFTLSLRRQLAETPIRVVEVIPPALNTDLGGKGLHDFAPPVDPFADAVFAALAAGRTEITYGFSEESSRASGEEREAIFERMNRPRR